MQEACNVRAASLPLSVHWRQSRRRNAKYRSPPISLPQSCHRERPRHTSKHQRCVSTLGNMIPVEVLYVPSSKSKLPSREFSAKRLAEKCLHPLDASCRRILLDKPTAKPKPHLKRRA